MSQTYTTETDPLGSFIILQDGEATSHYEALERELRQKAIHDTAERIGAVLGSSFKATARVTGGFVLDVMDAFAEAGKASRV